jgi:hypothetical protein
MSARPIEGTDHEAEERCQKCAIADGLNRQVMPRTFWARLDQTLHKTAPLLFDCANITYGQAGRPREG